MFILGIAVLMMGVMLVTVGEIERTHIAGTHQVTKFVALSVLGIICLTLGSTALFS